MIGQKLLHYQIQEKIGEGGMGVVYKALDTHLDRVVAVKVLPSAKVSDPERRQRFVQEAKAASALHHPNIIVVHDIASDQGQDFIVMEYVKGATLDQLIGRKGLKLNEALGYAVQAADGLARAHAAGIIHRDLKPTNIMVGEDGRVRILDFGLAKLTEEVEAAEVEATATLQRTDKPRTEDGYIVGTAAYMSPEQAEGKRVDARSDIFSFGVVLYEMLTGRRAFQRDSRVATLAAILREEPKPAGEVVETVPPEVEQLISRCLRKDPQRRWQTMSDLKVVLQDLKEDSDSGKLRTSGVGVGIRPRRRNVLWPLAGAVLLIVAASAVAWLVFIKKPSAPPEFEITRLTYESGATLTSAVSPDGQMFAFASDRAGNGDLDIWVQQVSGEKPLRLTDDPANDWYPSFSSDGSKIAFRSERGGGGIFIIDTLGGQARRLTERGDFPRFSPDGSWVSYVDVPASLESRLCHIYLVPPQGGTPRLFQPEFGLVGLSAASSPCWSPDGASLMFFGSRADDTNSPDWWVAPAAGGPAVRVNAGRIFSAVKIWNVPYAWFEDYIYFASGTTVEGVNLFRVAIDDKTFQLVGEAQRLTSGAGVQWLASVARNGRVVFSNMTWTSNIWSLTADPDRGTVAGEPKPLTQDLMAKFSSSVSRDGSKVAYEAFGGAEVHRDVVRLKDLSTGQEKTIPSQGIPFIIPCISPDGSTLAYSDRLPDGYHTFILARGDSVGREVCKGCLISSIFSDSGYGLVFFGSDGLFKLNFASGQKALILETRTGDVREAALSPDDSWLAFTSYRPDGRVSIKVAPLGEKPISEKDAIPILEDDRFLSCPQWSPDSRILYFLSERDGWCCIWGRRLNPRTKRPEGDIFPAYHAHRALDSLNLPPGSGALGVANDKFVFWMATVTGNIYMAVPKKR